MTCKISSLVSGLLDAANRVVKFEEVLSRKNEHERLMLHASEMGRKVYSKLGFKRTWEMRLDLVKK